MFREDEHIDHQADDALHDLLTAEQAARVERHAAACDRCAASLEKARQRLGLLQSLPPVEPSANLVPATLGRIADRHRLRRRLGKRIAWTSLAAVAAAALLLIGLQLYFVRLKPTNTDLVVLGQRELITASRASLRVRLTDRLRGVALSGVPILVTLLAPDGATRELARAATDDDGSAAPRFDVPDLASGSYELRVTAETGETPEVLTRTIQLRRSWRVLLSSDRPVYKPGQTILLRSLALRRPDLKPVAGERAVFSLVDPHGNVLFKQARPTSAFGISSAECELDRDILEGTYTVVCKIGDTESKLAVEVKRFVLPKFQVQIKLDRPFYAPGSKAQIQVRANYFFGKPVVNGRVKVALENPLPGDHEPMVETARTDDKGVARLSIPLPARFAVRGDGAMRAGDAPLKLHTTVTDGAGQEQSRLIDCLVTSHPVRVEAVPESGALVRGLPNRVHVLVRQAHGAAVPNVRVTVRRWSAQGEQGELLATVRTDERGAGSFSLAPEQIDAAIPSADGIPELPLTLAVLDVGGARLAEQQIRLPIGAANGDFLLRLDQPVYRAGQSLTITALGGGNEPVFVDLIRDGQTLLSDRIDMTNGEGKHVIDLPADVFGTLQMVAYRFDAAQGLPRRKTRVVAVLPPEGVKIVATLDQGEYRPRGRATLNLRLTDRTGKAVPGAVSLAAVDEAVFSVLAQRPGMEQTFFTLEQELLKPVYALYPAWMPTAEPRTAQRDRLLLSRTAGTLDGGSVQRNVPEATPQVSAVGPHTLAVRTLPLKQQQVAQRRWEGMHAVRLGWVGLIVVSLLMGYAALWLTLPLGTVLKLHGMGMLLMMFLGVLAGIAMLTFGHRVGSQFGLAGAKGGRDAPSASLKGARDDKQYDMTYVDPGDGTPLPRVRTLFPETLLWKPELITDDQGKLAPLTIPLADSITTWRLSASAVTADGRLGAVQMPIKVFQPFFVDLHLPAALTRGDELGVPVVVYNYSDQPQTVTLTLARPGKAWFVLTGPAEQILELAPGEVRSLRYPIRVTRVGTHKLQVTALAGKVGDAIEREITVDPDGRRVETTHSGSLNKPAEVTLNLPANVIEGSARAFVKFYPSNFSQLVEGLDGIFRMPNGCFEQTSSTTYPNVLALDYLRRNRLNVPAVEAKARQYIHLGYQRLVGFEVPGGGFDWYGQAPANVPLTAYGLMEFTDMARVHDVDPRLIERTRNWLLSRREADGSWKADPRTANLAGGGENADLVTTAYVAWAVHGGGKVADLGAVKTAYLLTQHRADRIDDPHTLALVANALLALDPQGSSAGPYLDRLVELRTLNEDGKFVFWQKPQGSRTVFYGGGPSANIETTALATLALIAGNRDPQSVRGALAWLVAQKDANGTWHSTQATILALKALVAGSKKTDDAKGERETQLVVGGHSEDVTSQPDVLKMVDITKHLKTGQTRIMLREKTKSGMGYQVVLRYHVPEPNRPAAKEPLTIALTYDRTELAVNESIKATARVVNRQAKASPMVMVDLPIPPGFMAQGDDFERMVKEKRIGRYQIQPRKVLVYLRGLEPDRPLDLEYNLQAQMVIKAAVSGARVYEYYDPQVRGEGRAAEVTVRSK